MVSLFIFATRNPRRKPESHYLGQGPDWTTHGLVCHTDKTHGNLLHAHLRFAALGFAVVGIGSPIGAGLRLAGGQEVIDLAGELAEVPHGVFGGERLVFSRAKDPGEVGGQQAAQSQVSICDRQRAT